MPIPATECLYFPDMVLDDVSKSIVSKLVLCWDAIYTIVPLGMSRPAKSDVEKELTELGILHSLTVAPYSKAVRLAGDAVSKIIDRNEIGKILSKSDTDYIKLYDKKLSYEISSALHWGKLPSEFTEVVAAGKGQRFWRVSREFASAYMAVLAKCLADQKHLALVTAGQRPFDLSAIATQGRPAPEHNLELNEPLEAETVAIKEAEGFLHQFLIRDLRIDPDTPLRKLDLFRRGYPAEIARYRGALQKAASDEEVQSAITAGDQKRLNDWAKTEVEPAITEMTESLRGLGINAILEQAVKISAISVPTSGLAIVAGVPPLVALGGQILLAITSSAIKIRSDRKQALAGKPYAYLYRLRERLDRGI